MSDADAFARATHYLHIGRPEQCLAELADADPSDVTVGWLRTWALLGVDELDEAVRVGRAALADHPDMSDLYIAVSVAHNRKREFRLAEDLLAAGVARLPDDVRLLCAYAEQLVASHHYEIADAVLRRAAQIAPESVDVALVRVVWARDTGAKREARRWAEWAMEADPDNPRVRQVAGWVARDQGRVSEAAGHLRSAALGRMDSRSLARDARAAGVLLRWPWRWFAPALRLNGWALGVTALLAILVLAGFERSGAALDNPVLDVVGWTLFGLWCAVLVYWIVPRLVRYWVEES